MLPHEPSAVESLLERSLGGHVPLVPFPPRPPEVTPRRRPRGWVCAAAAVVIVTLAGVALATRFIGRTDDSARPSASFTTAPTTAAPLIGHRLSSAQVGGVTVDYWRPAELVAAYRSVAPDDGVAAVGPAACAAGAPEERAWSWPDAPDATAGRYRCTSERGRAVMWWTVEATGVLGRAIAPDGDLAALFAWWSAQRDPA